jgi:serine protease Do
MKKSFVFFLLLIAGSVGISNATSIYYSDNENEIANIRGTREEVQTYPIPSDLTRNELPNLIKNLLPVVVSIKSADLVKSELTRYNNDYFYYNEVKNINSMGSGFIISKDGYVLTNAHVVDGADEIVIHHKSKEYVAELIGSDSVTDIAVLKINSNEVFQFVELKKGTKLKIGESVVIIGNPYNLGVSASYGIISALNRGIKNTEYNNLIQTDAAINRGNSGSPMFDLNGNAVGITSVIFSESGDNIGLGFAIPVDDIVDVVEMLKVHGYIQRGYLGINTIDVDSNILKIFNSKKINGVMVLDVVRGSTAEKAGILPSDIIISLDNKQVKDSNQLTSMIRNFSVDYTTNMLVSRNDSTVNLKVRIEEFPYSTKYDAFSEKLKNNSIEVFGMYLATIDKGLINRLELHSETQGLMVLDVRLKGIAEANGIEKGDIILVANQTQLKTKQDFIKVINQLKTKTNKNIVLIVKKPKIKRNTMIKLDFDAVNF